MVVEVRNYVDDCQDCIDPLTGEMSEALCMARREGGVCPQLPIIDRLILMTDWLADSWAMGREPSDFCDIENPTKQTLLEAAERAIANE